MTGLLRRLLGLCPRCATSHGTVWTRLRRPLCPWCEVEQALWDGAVSRLRDIGR